MEDIFAPYETIYLDNYKVYGKINVANTNEKMIQELPQGGGFSKLPFYCYAYDSIYSKALRLNELVYAPDNSIIRGTVIDYGDWVKHYASPCGNMVIRNCIGDSDIVSSDNYINNIGNFKPLDIDFTQVRLGMRYYGFNKTTKENFDIESTKELIENFNTGDYVVTETKCNIMYSDFSYNGNGQSEISINYNVGDKWVFGNHPLEWSQQGLQLVPQWTVKILQSETSSSPDFNATDGSAVLHGLGIEEVKILPEEEFHDLENGCLLYRYQTYSDGARYKPALTVEQCLKEVAFLGVAVCDYGGVNNLYMGYINSDGLATGELIPYSDWEKSDSLNIKNNTMSDYNESLEIKPKPLPDDVDDIDDMKLGVGGNYSGMVKYYRLSPAQLVAFSEAIQNPDVIPAGYDIFKNIIALKRYPINLSKYADFSDAEFMKVGSVTLNLSASRLAFEKRNISLGKYTIPGYHGSKEYPHFLDFSPYTTAEVFIPYCGFITLPVDKIMYNEIEVRLLVDVKLGNCTGIVKCNGNIVGEKAGILGSDIPLVAVNMGVAMGAIIQGLTDSTFGFASAIPYAATGNIGATFSGILNGTSALTQTIMSTKKNYTEVIGNTGGDIMFSMPDRCYIKLTYPKKKLPDNYGKMVGYMCGKGGRLGDFKGFTICENVHVDVKATEDEKQMILEKLLTGVIMPYNN